MRHRKLLNLSRYTVVSHQIFGHHMQGAPVLHCHLHSSGVGKASTAGLCADAQPGGVRAIC